MKRPMLVTGIITVIVCAFSCTFQRSAIIIPLLAALVLLFYILKRKSLKKCIIIPAICLTAIIATISFFSYNSKNISHLLKYHNTYETVVGKVISTPSINEYSTVFTLQADKIGNNNVTTQVYIALKNGYEGKVELYDYIVLEDSFLSVPTDEYGNYDLTQLSDGILLTANSYGLEHMWKCSKTPYYYCLRLKQFITETISLYMNQNNGALLTGMLFGDKASIDNSTATAFRNSGISHLLAVSGLHTSLWCELLVSLLSLLKIPQKPRSIVCLIFLVLFCIISGFTPSVMRASLMMGVVLIAPFFKRTPDSINSLGGAITFLLLINPYTVFSISFQLSACATLGVLIAGCVNIDSLMKKIPFKTFQNISRALLSSAIISAFAGLFTLPVSSYYFGVFSVAAPLSNILCVTLAFYGMIFGTISTALSFINIKFIKEICIFLFHITEFILDIVIALATRVSQFKYCTIPVHREYLLIGLFIASIIATTGYLIYKLKHRKAIIPTALLSVIAVFITISIPIVTPSYRNTVTIAKCTNGIQAIIRSGTSYAYIENTISELSNGARNALPKATCENFKYYIPAYLSKNSIENIAIINENFQPLETVMPEEILKTAKTNDISIPSNTTVANSGYFVLSDEITFETVDTTGIKYAIIRGKEKNVFIHLYGDTDFSKHLSDENCDIAIYNGALPSCLPPNAKTVIISTNDYNPIETNKLSRNCEEFYITAKHGSVTIYF